MPEMPFTENMPRYREDRVSQFYKTAVHYTNLDRELKPDAKTVDRPLFNEAILGFYYDKVDREFTLGNEEAARQRDLALAKASWALLFLEGVQLPELQQLVKGYDAPELDGLNAREVIASVAHEGARYATEQLMGNNVKKRGSNSGKAKEAVVRHEATFSSVEPFKDLEGFILNLYNSEQRISSSTAAELLFLFEQRTSTAPEEVKAKYRRSISESLMKRLRTSSITQPHIGDELADKTFAKGAHYIRVVVNTPMNGTSERSAIDTLAEEELAVRLGQLMRGLSGEDFQRLKQSTREDVLGHIGYVISKLY